MTAAGVGPAVVLGLGQNGLASVRALGRCGIPVIGVDANLEQATARSRYCGSTVRCPDMGSPAALIDTLVELGRTLPAPAALFPSGDLNLLAVSEHRGDLAPYYRIALPARETVRLILDKRAFARFARDRGIAAPRTWLVEPGTIGRIAGDLTYPALLKPYLRDASWRRSHDVKLFRVDSPAELLARHAEVGREGIPVFVQELVPGPDDQLAFSLTYLDDDLEPLGMFTGRKLRQWPPRFGTSSMAESRWDPRVAELSLVVLRALRYRGYGSVEFKYDRRDDTYKVIEVTGRTWYPHGLATRCGVNLPALAYRHLQGLPVERPRGFTDGIKWIDEERDLRSAMQYRREGVLALAGWVGSYRGRRTYALAALDDPAPLGHLLARAGRAVLRRWPPVPGDAPGAGEGLRGAGLPLTARRTAAELARRRASDAGVQALIDLLAGQVGATRAVCEILAAGRRLEVVGGT